MRDDMMRLARAGLAVIWLEPRSKKPIEAKWTEKRPATAEELAASYEPGMNAGVRLGKPSKIGTKYLHCVDLDVKDPDLAPQARGIALEALGLDESDLYEVKSGSGGESRHLYVFTSKPLPSRKLWVSPGFVMVGDKKHRGAEVELFGTGKQCVLPPSIHPVTGKRYVLPDPSAGLDLGAIPFVPAARLERAIKRADQPQREDPDPGMTIEEAERILDHLPEWADDRDTWFMVGVAIKLKFGKDGWPIFDEWSKQGRGYDHDENWAQWKTFRQNHENPITMGTLKRAARANGFTDTWEVAEEDIVDLFDDLPPKRGEVDDLIGSADDEPPPAEEEGSDDGPEAATSPSKVEVAPNPHRERGGLLGLDGRPVPECVLKLPGILGEISEWVLATATKPQPQFGPLVALAVGSVVLARNHITDQDNLSPLFFMGIAKSATGKEYVKTAIERILDAADASWVIIGDSFTSKAGMFSALEAAPKCIAVMDELGKMLSATRGSGDVHKNEAQTGIMEAFSRCNGVLRPANYSTRGMTPEQKLAQKNMKVVHPCLSITGVTTPDTIVSAIGDGDVADGFMNRWVTMWSTLERQPAQDARRVPVPESVVKWVKRHIDDTADFEGGGLSTPAHVSDPANPPNPVLVPFSEECRPLLREMDDLCRERMDELDGVKLSELFGRTREKAMRVALIIAVGKGEKVISLASLKHAWEFVRYYDEMTVLMFMKHVGKSEQARIADSILLMLEKAGAKGLTDRDIVRGSRAFERLDPKQSADVIARLVRDHGIKKEDIKTGGKNRMAWVFPD